jgi:hypothetical protein
LAQFWNDKGKQGVILMKCLFQPLPKTSITLIVIDGNGTGYPIGFDMPDTVDGIHNSLNFCPPRIISFSCDYLKPNTSRNMMQDFDGISHKYGVHAIYLITLSTFYFAYGSGTILVKNDALQQCD